MTRADAVSLTYLALLQRLSMLILVDYLQCKYSQIQYEYVLSVQYNLPLIC